MTHTGCYVVENAPSYDVTKNMMEKMMDNGSFNLLDDFAHTLNFPLDGFQRDACMAIEQNKNVLVAAPTGAGKTLVGEFAIHRALHERKKAFYTAPIKALSNQKYHDLVKIYGEDAIGLLTGDTSINSEAQIVVMTTEVLRNMLYDDSSTLEELGYVVMDEVHYLADRARGAVWEEVIINLPEDILLVSLSATISNAEEFGDWLDTVRGETQIIVSEHRPVPLLQHMMAGGELFDMFADEKDPRLAKYRSAQETSKGYVINPRLRQLKSSPRNSHYGRGRHGYKSGYSRHPRTIPGRIPRYQILQNLDKNALLPAIYFIFSRNGCDDAVKHCIARDVRLTTDREQHKILEYVTEATRHLDHLDLQALDFYSWKDGLLRGIAAHHAGLLPLYKDVVEKLFSQGLLKVVFATETLALGINMPARSVVLEKLTKFNGENHVDITPGQYTQLTGRAGRRGIDIEGHAVVIWKRGLDPDHVASLASKRTYPLDSSFSPTYNMSANLVARFGTYETKKTLESSFAQFQADKSVVGVAQRVRKNERALAGYQKSLSCERGDYFEYAQLVRAVRTEKKNLEKRRRSYIKAVALESLKSLRSGDIIELPGGHYRGYATVLQCREARDGVLEVDIINEKAQHRALPSSKVEAPIEPVSYVKIPRKVRGRSVKERQDIASRMRTALHEGRPPRRDTSLSWEGFPSSDKLENLRQQMQEHPCHECPDKEEHARWEERWRKLDATTQTLRRQIDTRTNTIAKVFERITRLLEDYGYMYHDEHDYYLTEAGENLRRLHGEREFLLSLCLEDGFLDGLDSAATASVISAVVYHSKSGECVPLEKYPHRSIELSLQKVYSHWEQLSSSERRSRLPVTSAPDFGFVWSTYQWARGKSLSEVLEHADMSAGDFVRWMRQVIDVLNQISHVSVSDVQLRTQCEAAVLLIRRGVVMTEFEGR
ncbi:DEAD/DEAH box helicase [Rothia sp. P6271]|uniref:DEAD/DEAH box helicase n=1 Tax=Rothia sp. P6271 TaxID=3402659 RepID=UPI003AD7906A